MGEMALGRKFRAVLSSRNRVQTISVSYIYNLSFLVATLKI